MLVNWMLCAFAVTSPPHARLHGRAGCRVSSPLEMQAEANKGPPTSERLKSELLSLIPRRRDGSPVTNVTLDALSVRRIERTVARLEARGLAAAGRPAGVFHFLHTTLSLPDRRRSTGPGEPFTAHAGAFAESPAALAALDGPWRLLYSDASEITNLAKLPLGQ